jgi:ketosteroid isomerase-like protein
MENDSVLLARASMDAWNRHDLDAYLSFFAAEASYVGPRREVHGISAIRDYMEMLMEAFPDEQATVETVAACADTVFVKYTDRAHHLGLMRWSAKRQIEPTGHGFTYAGVTELTFREGRIIFARDYFDLYDVLFVQLGFPFPEPGRGATISECPAPE